MQVIGAGIEGVALGQAVKAQGAQHHRLEPPGPQHGGGRRIAPGTPGRILSAGLILPLNVAVGFVVCCTMYSLYMYFRRGEL